jgi:hypothetical protein
MTTHATARPPSTPLPGGTKVPAQNPIGMLTRIYREAGMPIEAARRCALADFQCSFPHYLGGV